MIGQGLLLEGEGRSALVEHRLVRLRVRARLGVSLRVR